VKKLAARRLSEGSKQTAEEQLNSVVGKLDELTKTLSESKSLRGESVHAPIPVIPPRY
ncbi:hypothetical protein AK812_SmicGene46906, partial [Symbiodinium microadriaticum]